MHQNVWKRWNRPRQLVYFVFPIEVPGEYDPLSFQKLRIDICTWIRWNLKGEFSRVLSHDLYWETRTYKLKRSIARRDVSWTLLGAMLQTHTPAIFLVILFIVKPFWPSTLIRWTLSIQTKLSEKFPEIPKAVEFPKCEPFNQRL